MRLVLPAVALVLVVGVTLVDIGSPEQGSSVRAPATTSAAPPPLDHVDDYSAPVEELIDHADHLDFSRLDPQKRAALEAELARRRDTATALWTAYGALVGGAPGDPPPGRVDAPELAYLLLAARADQLADAAARAGSLPSALSTTGADHPEVTVVEQDGCVSVTWSQDPFARSFGAGVAEHDGGDLRDRLLQRVRVGVAGEPACEGEPPAFSPTLEALLATR